MPAAKTLEQKYKDAIEHNEILIRVNTDLVKENKELKELVVKSISRVKSSLYNLQVKCLKK